MSVPESNPLPAKTRKQNALAYARKGIPGFPCKKGEKAPCYERNVIEHGYLDATTDPRKLSAWWNKWPEANIGIPTGKASNLLVVDMDTYKPGAMTEEEFEQKYGGSSTTATVRTGSGGIQFYFLYPEGEEIRNSAGMLGPHVDVRGEGGYVLAPSSETTRRYEWINKAPPAPLPPKLLEALREEPRSPGRPGHSRPQACKFVEDGGPIPEGSRNVTLTSIAGYLHDGSRDLPELTSDLLQVNAGHCTPPLEADEVAGIAKSIHRLEPCKKGLQFNPPTPEVIGILGSLLRDWWSTEWRGPGGKSDRDVLLTYILFAIEGGNILPNGGILVDASHHQVAERSRKSSSTAYNAHRRLSVKGWCRGGGNGPDRREDRPSGIVLLPRHTKDCKPEHPLPAAPAMGGVFGFATLPTARRGRHSAPGLARIASASRIAAIDYLERFGGYTPEEILADAIGISRVYDLRKRYLEPLEERGVVERIEHRIGRRVVYSWRLLGNWQAALERIFAEEEELERQLYSGLTSDERQRRRREESRERWRSRDNVRPDPAPTHDELRRRREAPPEAPSGSLLSDLARAIRAYLDRKPLDASQRPGWIGSTLWAYDLYPDKPSSAEVRAAIDELGGQAYLRSSLERARRVA